ncbi:MAG: TetR/AcrR family transcriptional regulator [Thermoanaerobaculia bacterium]|nr:TetR/AcrR family transcriptional regulator [Thermoanaerobaculia bacterium]
MGKGRQTRASILDTALAEASRSGLDGITIGALARKVEMSKSGLFAHFDSKEDLQLQILETASGRFVEHVVRPALREPRGEPRIRALFENWLQWEESRFLPGGCPFVATATELDDRPGPLRDALVQAQRDWRSTLATAARLAMEEGHFRADLDTEQFAYDFFSVILAYHHFSRLLREPDAGKRCRRAFDRLLASCRTRGSRPPSRSGP